MSTEIFAFPFLSVEAPGGRYDEYLVAVDSMSVSQGGRTAVINRAAQRKFMVPPSVLQLPDSAGTYDPSDFWDFWDARSGRVDTFLYKAQYARFREIVKESVGTASGGGGETFALTYKHIDASTLIVYVDDVEQTITTDYTFGGNNTAPLVTSTASMDTGAVTASFDFYMPVRFSMDTPSTTTINIFGGNSLTAQEYVQIMVSMEEALPGARLA